MSERKVFNPLGSEFASYGEFTMGQDGTMLYTAMSVDTGLPVTVVLYADMAQLASVLAVFRMLGDKQQDYAKRMKEHKYQRVNLTPADKSFQAILDDLKNGTKH